jgi:transposase
MMLVQGRGEWCSYLSDVATNGCKPQGWLWEWNHDGSKIMPPYMVALTGYQAPHSAAHLLPQHFSRPGLCWNRRSQRTVVAYRAHFHGSRPCQWDLEWSDSGGDGIGNRDAQMIQPRAIDRTDKGTGLQGSCIARRCRVAVEDHDKGRSAVSPARHLRHSRWVWRSASRDNDRQFGGEGTSIVCRGTQVPGKKGDQEQAIGRSRGGRTTKIHALVDGEGRPHALLLTGGNVADITGAAQLLAVTEPSTELIGDANHLRAFLQARGTLVVIPNKVNRVNRYPFDQERYRSRNTSSAPLVVSRTSAQSQPDMTRQPATSSPASVLPPPSSGGSIESRP